MCLTTWEQILVGCHRIISVRLGLLFWEKLGWCVDKMAARCFCEKMIFRHKRGLVFAVSHVKFYHRNHVDYDINPLRPSDAIWRQWFWTTLAQVMACCLTAPSHYLNQCWLIIRGVLWHTSESSFAGIAQGIDSGYEFEKDILKNIFKSPRGQWVKMWKVIVSLLGIVVFNPDTFVLLTHRTLMPHICVCELGQHWFRWWLVACLAPSHYLNHHWLIVNPIHRN